MVWRLKIEHRTGFHYGGTVHASYNEARLTPLDGAGQHLLEHRVEVHPPAPLFRYRDYWGTEVHAFDLHRPHTELHVLSTSVVQTSVRPNGQPAHAVSWSALREPATIERWCELLAPTGYTSPAPELAEAATRLRSELTPLATVEAIVAWVGETLEYEQGSTDVHTTAAEALRARHGVCQDFVHLALVVLREVGIPARYTSGYLHPASDPPVGESVVGESHAWFEAWLGEWLAFDPTNGDPVGPRHVAVAHGRDYADVAPLRGIYHGSGGETLEVDVRLTRTA